MKKVEHDLLTEKYTKVYHEEHFTNFAPHHFVVVSESETGSKNVLSEIHFQEGPIKEVVLRALMRFYLSALKINLGRNRHVDTNLLCEGCSSAPSHSLK